MEAMKGEIAVCFSAKLVNSKRTNERTNETTGTVHRRETADSFLAVEKPGGGARESETSESSLLIAF